MPEKNVEHHGRVAVGQERVRVGQGMLPMLVPAASKDGVTQPGSA